MELEFISLKPTQNSYVERFNKTYRNEIRFLSVQYADGCERNPDLIKEYNEERPHDSLGKMTPAEFVVASTQNISTYDTNWRLQYLCMLVLWSFPP